MPNAFDNAIAHAQTAIAGVAGRSVVYRRDDVAQTIDDVVVGQSRFEVTEASGFQTQVVVRDYLLPVAAMADFTPSEPEDGDRIEETADGKVHVYEVLRPSSSEPAWRYRDPARSQLRIHTKHVETRDA